MSGRVSSCPRPCDEGRQVLSPETNLRGVSAKSSDVRGHSATARGTQGPWSPCSCSVPTSGPQSTAVEAIPALLRAPESLPAGPQAAGFLRLWGDAGTGAEPGVRRPILHPDAPSGLQSPAKAWKAPGVPGCSENAFPGSQRQQGSRGLWRKAFARGFLKAVLGLRPPAAPNLCPARWLLQGWPSPLHRCSCGLSPKFLLGSEATGRAPSGGGAPLGRSGWPSAPGPLMAVAETDTTHQLWPPSRHSSCSETRESPSLQGQSRVLSPHIPSGNTESRQEPPSALPITSGGSALGLSMDPMEVGGTTAPADTCVWGVNGCTPEYMRLFLCGSLAPTWPNFSKRSKKSRFDLK
nr:uncharacterized protein LOC105487641 [Macaca nemestrina]